MLSDAFCKRVLRLWRVSCFFQPIAESRVHIHIWISVAGRHQPLFADIFVILVPLHARKTKFHAGFPCRILQLLHLIYLVLQFFDLILISLGFSRFLCFLRFGEIGFHGILIDLIGCTNSLHICFFAFAPVFCIFRCFHAAFDVFEQFGIALRCRFGLFFCIRLRRSTVAFSLYIELPSAHGVLPVFDVLDKQILNFLPSAPGRHHVPFGNRIALSIWLLCEKLGVSEIVTANILVDEFCQSGIGVLFDPVHIYIYVGCSVSTIFLCRRCCRQQFLSIRGVLRAEDCDYWLPFCSRVSQCLVVILISVFACTLYGGVILSLGSEGVGFRNYDRSIHRSGIAATAARTAPARRVVSHLVGHRRI